jgi:hypothetical protein
VAGSATLLDGSSFVARTLLVDPNNHRASPLHRDGHRYQWGREPVELSIAFGSHREGDSNPALAQRSERSPRGAVEQRALGRAVAGELPTEEAAPSYSSTSESTAGGRIAGRAAGS